MRPHDELRFAGSHAFERRFFLRRFHSADQQFHAVARAREYFSRGQKMLHGQNFRRRHQRGLIAVFDDDGRRFKRDDRFAAAHVALQQAIHRHAAFQVRRDFPERPLLRVGGLERQHALDRFADGRLAHAKRDPRLLLRRFLPHGDAQLVKEKFLENQAQVGLRTKRIQRLDRFRRGRKMHELDRFAPRREFVPRQNFRGQRIGHRAAKIFQAPDKRCAASCAS